MLKEDWYLRDRLKLRHLAVLTTLFSLGHVGRAAERLHTTQPAISKALGELEKMVGVRLFERSPAGLVPTQHCAMLVERAREMFGALGRVRDDFAAAEAGIEGVINIGASHSATALLLPHTILRLKELLPRVSVTVHDGAFAGLLHDLRTHGLDFVVGRLEPNADMDDLAETVLFNMNMVMLCARDHPLLRKRSVTLPDLADWPWVMPPSDSATRRGMELLFHEIGRRPEGFGVECSSMLANAVMVQHTQALAIAAVPTASIFASSGLLSIVPVSLPPLFGHISLFRLKGEPGQIKDEIFIDCALKAASELGKDYAAARP